MNLLTVIQRYHPVIGGSELLTKRYMDYLSQKHKVTVLTSNANDIHAFWDKSASTVTGNYPLNYEVKRYEITTPQEIKFDSTLLDFPIPTSHPGPFVPKLWNELVFEKIDCDLIFATCFPYDHIIPAYVGAKKWNKPIIIMPLIHQQFPELFLTSFRLTMLKHADAVLVISESEKQILQKFGIDEKKISLIRPIIDIYPQEEIKLKEFSQKFSIPETSKIILFIGSKSIVKGIIFLIESMMELWKKRQDIVLLMIGPKTKEFEEYYSKLPKKFQKNIIDLDITDDQTKNQAIRSSDIVVLPSISESFGLVYFEAWLSEKPVIGCDIEPVSEIINHKQNGMLVKFGNNVELMNAISYLADNPDICKQYGENGKEKTKLYTSKDNLKIFEEKCLAVINNFKK